MHIHIYNVAVSIFFIGKTPFIKFIDFGISSPQELSNSNNGKYLEKKVNEKKNIKDEKVGK